MEGKVFEAAFEVKKVVDCSKEYDRIGRVEMLGSNGEPCVLDVNSHLFPQLLRVGAKIEAVLCTELRITDQLVARAEDQAFSPEVAKNLGKLHPHLNYVMHGTVFEFQQQKDKVVVYISFGGLLMILTEKAENLTRFKSGQQLYLVCFDAR